MLSFGEYLTEIVNPRHVYKDTSISAMKNISKNIPGNTLRWIVDKNNKIHEGSSLHHDHSSIHYEAHGNENNDYEAYGFVKYHPKTKEHYYALGWGNLSDKYQKQLDKHFKYHDKKGGNEN